MPPLLPARRPPFALTLLAILLSLTVVAPSPQAMAEGFEETLFRSDFDRLPAGALGATPVTVEVGTVLAATTPVEIATVSGLDDRALTVTGAGVAELRLSSYPGKLPQVLNSQRYDLRVRAELVAPVANAQGASLYLSGGRRETQPIVIVVVVPPPGAIPTAAPGTTTPTVTGTPPRATPSPVPPTATPTASGG